MHVRLINGRHVVFRNGLPVRTALGTTLSTSDPTLAQAMAAEDERLLPGVSSPISLMLLQATYLDYGSTTSLDDLRQGLIDHWENDWLAAVMLRGLDSLPVRAVLDPGQDPEAWWRQGLADCGRRTLVGLTVAAANTGSALLGWLLHAGKILPHQAARWLCHSNIGPIPKSPQPCLPHSKQGRPEANPPCLNQEFDERSCPMYCHLEEIRWFCALPEEPPCL